jgi:hypothetical protein
VNEPEDFIRDGLSYEYAVGRYYYYPVTEFVVDGICYRMPSNDSVHIRPLFDTYDDHLRDCRCGSGASPMWCSNPPTDTELDRWVRTGRNP